MSDVVLRGRDGLVLATLKLLARLPFEWQIRFRRWRSERRGEERWKLGGTCGQCAACCEEPSIQVDRLIWHLRSFRALFLWWQRAVNGFEFVGTERPRIFVFRCHYFDRQTRRCTSYATRPGICRDYPRSLLQQPWPEFLPGCGYRPVARHGAEVLVALGRTSLSEEQKEELRKRMRLD